MLKVYLRPAKEVGNFKPNAFECLKVPLSLIRAFITACMFNEQFKIVRQYVNIINNKIIFVFIF